MKLTVTLSQSHIDNGVRHTCTLCPVALALKDRYSNVSISNYSSIVDNITLGHHQSVINFITNFDHYESVCPCTLELDFDSKVMRII